MAGKNTEFITANEEKIPRFKWYFILWCAGIFFYVGTILYIYLKPETDNPIQMLSSVLALVLAPVYIIFTYICFAIFHAFRNRRILEEKGKKVKAKIEYIRRYRGSRGYPPTTYNVLVSYREDGKIKVWTSQKYYVDPNCFLKFYGGKGNCTLLKYGHRIMLDRDIKRHSYDNGYLFYRDVRFAHDRFILSKVNRRTLCGMAVFSDIYLILETKDILPKEGQTALLSTSQMGACALLIIGGLFLATAIIWSVISIIKERQRAEKHWR